MTGLQGSPVTFTSTAMAGSGPRLAITTQPSSSAQSGVALAIQPVIQLQDADGNNQAQGGVDVTASIASGTGTLGGTVTQATGSNGVATFTDLAISGAAGPYTLRFSAAGDGLGGLQHHHPGGRLGRLHRHHHQSSGRRARR